MYRVPSVSIVISEGVRVERITEHLRSYAFDPVGDYQFENQIYVLEGDTGYLVIDAGFPEQTALLMDLLADKTVDTLILSHYHGDHIDGMHVMSARRVIGSCHFEKTLARYYGDRDPDRYRPDVAVEGSFAFNFDGHAIEVFTSPGHSPCTVLTRIDGRFLHTADEVMWGTEDRLLLPSTDSYLTIPRSLESLERLEGMAAEGYLPGHGSAKTPVAFLAALRDVQRYYLAVARHLPEEISVKRALEHTRHEFCHEEWHAGIYRT